jgi:hypothetical protein
MIKAAFLLACLCTSWAAFAQQLQDTAATIRQEREVLAQERARITHHHDQLAKECWQKFAVNDCLAVVRKSRRAELDPLHLKELALNAQEREWRTQQRLERLQNKANGDGGRLEQ